MPGMDGTGPTGNGPYGRGMGPCGRGQPTRGFGFGFGRGFRGRFGRWGYGPGAPLPEDINSLENQKSFLQSQLDVLNQRIQGLTGKQEGD